MNALVKEIRITLGMGFKSLALIIDNKNRMSSLWNRRNASMKKFWNVIVGDDEGESNIPFHLWTLDIGR